MAASLDTGWLLLGPHHTPFPNDEMVVPQSLAGLELPAGYLESLRVFGQGSFLGSRWLLPPAHLQTIGSRLGTHAHEGFERGRLEALWIVAADDAGNFWAFSDESAEVMRVDRGCACDEDLPAAGVDGVTKLLAEWVGESERPFFTRRSPELRLVGDLASLTPHFDMAALAAELDRGLLALGWTRLSSATGAELFGRMFAQLEAHLVLYVSAHSPSHTRAATNGRLRFEWLGPEHLEQVRQAQALFARLGWSLDTDGPRTVRWDGANELPDHVANALFGDVAGSRR